MYERKKYNNPAGLNVEKAGKKNVTKLSILEKCPPLFDYSYSQ